MAIIYPNKSITSEGSAINVPGSVIQFVDNTTTVNVSVATGSWVNILSTAITTSKAGNIIQVEYMCDHRNDYGQGSWCLVYHRVLVTGGGLTNSQVMNSGHMGSASPHIHFYEKTFNFTTTTQGTYTFTASVYAHQGTAWIGAFNGGGCINHYLRLYEIGT